MSNNSKNILKVGLVIYFVYLISRIFYTLDIEGIDIFVKLRNVSIPITTIIILAYVNDKGAKTLCKIGLAFIVVNLLLDILIVYEVIELNLASTEFFDKFIIALSRLTGGGTSLCGIIALLYLIPPFGSQYEMVKKCAIYLYIVYVAINVVYVFIDSNNIDWLTKTESIVYILSNAAQYGFIIFYLLNKTGESSEESIIDSVLDNQSNLGSSRQEAHQMLSQDLQPKQEDVKPIIPDALQTPVEEQKVTMPVIQQAVINEQLPEAPAASPLPQIKPPEIEQSNILKQPETPTVEPSGGQPLEQPTEQQTEQPKGASIIQ